MNVIAKFSEDMADQSRHLVESLLREHFVKLYNFDNLEPLLNDIRTAASNHKQPEPSSLTPPGPRTILNR